MPTGSARRRGCWGSRQQLQLRCSHLPSAHEGVLARRSRNGPRRATAVFTTDRIAGRLRLYECREGRDVHAGRGGWPRSAAKYKPHRRAKQVAEKTFGRTRILRMDPQLMESSVQLLNLGLLFRRFDQQRKQRLSVNVMPEVVGMVHAVSGQIVKPFPFQQ